MNRGSRSGQGWRKSCVVEVVLLLLSVAGAVLAQDQPNCTRSGTNVTCHGLSVRNGSTLEHLSLAVENCRDPVLVTLVMSVEEECSWSVSVDGENESRSRLQSAGWQQLSAVFNRNASHLHFQLLEDGGQNSTAVLVVLDVPLNPADCMCASMERAANRSSSCSFDNSSCSGFSCVLGVSHIRVAIDPCTEVVTVDLAGNSHNFSHSQNWTISNNILNVTVEQYKYSMLVGVVVEDDQQQNQTLLLSQQIILDRSSCTQLTAFPATGAPHSGPPDGYQCHAAITTTRPTITQPPSLARRTSLVVAVTVPISLVVLTVVVIATVLLVLVAYKKRRAIQFRRIAVDVIDYDDL